MICTAVKAVKGGKEQKMHCQQSIQLDILLAGKTRSKVLSH